MSTHRNLSLIVRLISFAALLPLAANHAVAQTPDRQVAPQAKPDVQLPDAPLDEKSAVAAEAKAAKPTDPLSQLLAASNTKTTLGRAKLRDNLYALLATASDEKAAKRIAGRIEKLWLAHGSQTVSLLLARAGRALTKKKPELALQFLDAAVDLAPDFAEAFNRRAFVHYEAGNVRAAVGDLRRALALDPSHFKALSGLANIMSQTGQDAAALKAYETLLDVHPFANGAQKAHDELREKVGGRAL